MKYAQILSHTKNEKECWITTYKNNFNGYCQVKIDGKRQYLHRWAYEFFNGEIPKDMIVLHNCDNTRCINPEHLILGTRKENSEDMVSKGRQAKGERHGQARLTEKQVKEIRIDKRTAMTIAKENGVSKATIDKIRRGLIWKSLY
jgi:hypothetical protein